MVYVYTDPTCPECKKLKDKLCEEGKPFEERPITRLVNAQDHHTDIRRDHIDLQAMVELHFANMRLPVVVEM